MRAALLPIGPHVRGPFAKKATCARISPPKRPHVRISTDAVSKADGGIGTRIWVSPAPRGIRKGPYTLQVLLREWMPT